MRTRLGVLGWPVGHSLSPALQNAALQSTGLTEWRYQLLPVPPELFAETVAALAGAGFKGVNVTIPHKEAALALASAPTERARAIGAANLLMFEPDGAVLADNTDAPALISSLPFSPHGRTALVLGAGGSARAAVWALRDAGAAAVRVWNRTPERAQRLAAELGVSAATDAESADVLVHCTPSGLADPDTTFKNLPLSADDLLRFKCVVDFVYRATETRLIAAARERSVPVVGGLELLVAQGALSFERFTGLRAPVEAMRAAVQNRD